MPHRRPNVMASLRQSWHSFRPLHGTDWHVPAPFIRRENGATSVPTRPVAGDW
jgi:hypothetical protein